MSSLVKNILIKLAIIVSGYVLLLPVLILVIFINNIVRCILKIVLFCTRSKLHLISNGIDNLFPGQADSVGGIILGIVVSPGVTKALDLEAEQNYFLESVIHKKLAPNGIKVYQTLEMVLEKKLGYGCRKKSDTFDIKEHVKVWSGSAPVSGDFYTEDEFFTGIIPKLAQDFEDYSAKPGWEWIIIPRVQIRNLQDDGDPPVCIRILRCHHSYMDGLSAALLVTECLMNFQSSSVPFFINPKANLPVKVGRRILLGTVLGFLQLPFHLMSKAFYGKSNTGVECDPIFERRSGLRNFGVSKSLSFESVRDLKSKLESSGENQNTTTTNVLASIVVSALGQILSRTGDLSNNSTLTFSTPTAILPYPDSQPRNAVVPNHFCIPLGEVANHAGIQLIDATPSYPAIPTHYILSCVGRLPAPIAGNIVKFASQRFPASTVFTSVPGTRAKGSLGCCGSFVSDVGGWSVLPRQIGVSVVAINYGGEIRFWCVVDDAVMNRQEFDDFLDLLIAKNQY